MTTKKNKLGIARKEIERNHFIELGFELWEKGIQRYCFYPECTERRFGIKAYCEEHMNYYINGSAFQLLCFYCFAKCDYGLVLCNRCIKKETEECYLKWVAFSGGKYDGHAGKQKHQRKQRSKGKSGKSGQPKQPPKGAR